MPARSEIATLTHVAPSHDKNGIVFHGGQVALILLLLFVHGAGAVPEVNEAHYLGKAKHYWDSSFCENDFFYSSDDAHSVFFFTFGWLTQLCSLPTAAWIGRGIGWLLLATAWHGLSFALIPIRGASMLTAALWLTLIELTQMSGEWIAGGIEAKVIAYACVIAGLRQIVIQRWTTAWMLLGIGSAFHVLVGGWAVVMAAFGWASLPRPDRPPWQTHVIGCFLGGLIALLGLIPALRLNVGVPQDVAQQASQIYVHERLSHHLLLRVFPSLFVARHMLITAAFLALLWKSRQNEKLRRLLGYCAGATFLLIIGAGLDAGFGDTPFGTAVLRFYWFRASDVFMPLAVSLASVYWAVRLAPKFPRATKAVWVATVIGLMVHATVVVAESHRAPIPAADRQGGIRHRTRLENWRDACHWIGENVPQQAIILTPSNHQTFKWYAGRAEVVNWKDVPQDASHLVQWSRRLKAVRAWRSSPMPSVAEQRLLALRRDYGFDYVVTGWPSVHSIDQTVPIYRNAYYAVHRFRTELPSTSVEP